MTEMRSKNVPAIESTAMSFAAVRRETKRRVWSTPRRRPVDATQHKISNKFQSCVRKKESAVSVSVILVKGGDGASTNKSAESNKPKKRIEKVEK